MQLRECGALDCIVELLASSSEPQTQRAALAALRTFTDGNTTNKAYMAECGALEALVKVSKSCRRRQAYVSGSGVGG